MFKNKMKYDPSYDNSRSGCAGSHHGVGSKQPVGSKQVKKGMPAPKGCHYFDAGMSHDKAAKNVSY